MSERSIQKSSRDLRAEIAHLKSICEDDPELITDMIEGETDLDGFIGRVVAMIGEDGTAIRGISEYQKTIADRKRRLESRQTRMRTLLASVVTELPGRKIRHPLATVTVSDISPKPIIEDESKIPSTYFKERDPILDKSAIRHHLLKRQAALDELTEYRDQGERVLRRSEIDRELPEIAGVSLDNGDISIAIRMG